VDGISTQTDLNGNMVSSPLKTENGTLKTGIYAYDAQNRLTSATVNGATTEFTYDSRNRVVQRASGNGTLNLTYSGWNLIEELDATGALEQVYVHGAGIDEILVKITPSGPAYYHHDGLGSTVALTGGTGQLLESCRYDAFGAVSVFNSSGLSLQVSGLQNRFLFTGREWLSEAGLYEYRNRAYSAELGRFLQTDPIRFSAGDVNLYRYVSNNPINWVDPLGLETAVQIGMGTGMTRNPFGHTALATSGQGVHSFGTDTPQGSSFSDYLNEQAGYRDSMIYVLPTNPEQEKAINDYLNSLEDDLPPVPSEDSRDNCASRTSDALTKAGMDVGSNPTPAQLQRALEKMVKDGNALRFSVPKGSSPSDAWQTCNPR